MSASAHAEIRGLEKNEIKNVFEPRLTERKQAARRLPGASVTSDNLWDAPPVTSQRNGYALI